MWTKLTDREAIAKVMQVRDDIRNYKTDKYEKMDENLRKEYTVALAQVINLAQSVIDGQVQPKKTGVDLFREVLSEKMRGN